MLTLDVRTIVYRTHPCRIAHAALLISLIHTYLDMISSGEIERNIIKRERLFFVPFRRPSVPGSTLPLLPSIVQAEEEAAFVRPAYMVAVAHHFG